MEGEHNEQSNQHNRPKFFAANVLENMDGQHLQTQLPHYRWRRIIVAVVLGLALLYGIFYCIYIAIDYIFYLGYVIIGEAEEDEMPISISTPVK